jgi:hypothetical protein
MQVHLINGDGPFRAQAGGFLDSFLILVGVGDLKICLHIHTPDHENIRAVIDAGFTSGTEFFVDFDSHDKNLGKFLGSVITSRAKQSQDHEIATALWA